MKKIGLKFTKHSFASFYEGLLITLMLMGGGYLSISLFMDRSYGWAIGWTLASLLLGQLMIYSHDKDSSK